MTITNSEIFGIALEQRLAAWDKEFPYGPQVAVKLNRKMHDTYKIEYNEHDVSLAADALHTVLSGLGALEIGLKSGFVSEFIGKQEAIFSWRILWLKGAHELLSIDSLCRKISRLGFNAVILEEVPQDISVFKAYGIRLILKPAVEDLGNFCPLDEEWPVRFAEKIALLPPVDALFWEGCFTKTTFLNHPKARDLLQYDLAVMELEALQVGLAGHFPLIYQLPNDLCAEWLPEFLDESGKETMIAFSALAGDPAKDHLPENPLWKMLRKCPDISYTPLLPVINGGAIGQGDGLWPIIPVDTLECVISHLENPPFQGAIVMTKTVPDQAAFLDGALWTAGQSLSRGRSPRRLLEAWCAAYHPQMQGVELLNEVRNASKQLSLVRSLTQKMPTEECRVLADSLLAQLNRIQLLAAKDEDQALPSLKEYFTFFARDARRQVLHFLQSHHLPLVNVLNGEDLLESFWTGIGQMGNSGIGSGAKVALLSQPSKGAEGSMMRKIYEQTFPEC